MIVLQPYIFELSLSNGEGSARINPPCAHSGIGPVHTRLLSYTLREGQVSLSTLLSILNVSVKCACNVCCD